MIDFLDKDFIENPYPALEQLRAEGKPIWHEGVQMYLAARYDDANEVLRTTATLFKTAFNSPLSTIKRPT